MLGTILGSYLYYYIEFSNKSTKVGSIHGLLGHINWGCRTYRRMALHTESGLT